MGKGFTFCELKGPLSLRRLSRGQGCVYLDRKRLYRRGCLGSVTQMQIDAVPRACHGSRDHENDLVMIRD